MTDNARTAVVTGAARGLGFETARQLGAAGYRLWLLDLSPLAEPLAELRAAGIRAEGLSGDLSSEAFVREAVGKVTAGGAGVDALVNNAGISLIRPAEETTLADWRRVQEVNLQAPFLLCREFGAAMLARRAGAIVNVASVAGLGGIGHRAAYNASKHGLIGLTRTLAAEWGGRGVRVNAVCPGWIKTDMDERDQGSGAYSDTDITDRVPMARFARAADVAAAIVWLLDPKAAAFVNGACLPVDGGWSADLGWDELRLKNR